LIQENAGPQSLAAAVLQFTINQARPLQKGLLRMVSIQTANLN